MAVHRNCNTKNYKIAIWNANGLSQHLPEVKTFITNQDIDIMLISETHSTNKTYIRIPKYKIYDSKYPNNKAHGGAAIIIRENIKHHEMEKHEKEHLQAASVSLEDGLGGCTISALYYPPKHKNKKEDYEQFFKTLGSKFIAGGDYNAKHSLWGSRLTTTKGRELAKAIRTNNLNWISTGEPTYWPSDRNKTPDLIDFCVTKGIDTAKVKAESCLDLSSDHSPIIINVYSQIIEKEKRPTLFSKRTDWNIFREELDRLISLNIPLKTEKELEEAVNTLTTNIQQAAWQATPDSHNKTIKETIPHIIKQKITEKRALRKTWQETRYPPDKTKLNKATKRLKEMISQTKNKGIQLYLENLSASEASDYSLWKATKKLKSPQVSIPPIKDENNKWARNDKEKANVFAQHLAKVFQPYPPSSSAEEEDDIMEFQETPFQMDFPIKKFRLKEVEKIIYNDINPKKAPGYDLITGKILQEITTKCLKAILQIFNAVIRINHFPNHWKIAQIVMIPKPGKKPDDVKSYRPISLLPVLSKILEKLILQQLKPIIEERNLIPNHQFGFRNHHGTIEQVHRIVNHINRDLQSKRYCSAAFLDISQAFDKVWHLGLLYKLKKNLPYHHYQILESYLSNRYFQIMQQNEYTNLYPINSGVPQGSILGPILYLLYTSDLPTTDHTTVATFADDTAILSSHNNPIMASRNLQENLNKIQDWLQKWRIKANETKSTQVTFTMRKGTCPPVKINGCQLPQSEDAKYLGMHLDRRLTWRKHIFTKRKQLGLKLNQMYWIIGRSSQLSIENKVLIYKAILKPIWTYGVQLWGSAAESNLEILQRFQNKVLRIITDAPRYIPNRVIQRDIPMSTVKEVIQQFSARYHRRLTLHPNVLANQLVTPSEELRRLKRYQPEDLMTRFD